MHTVLDEDDRKTLDEAWSILIELAKRDKNTTAEKAAELLSNVISISGE